MGSARQTMRMAGLVCVMGIAGLVAPAQADVTIVQKTTGKGAGEQTTRIKGNKMRIETVSGDNTTAVLMDLDTQQMTMLDVKKKEAVVMPVAQLQEAMGKAGATVNIKSKVTPTGEKKTVSGYPCTVHDIAIAMPFVMGEGGEAAMTMLMQGPACLSKELPGQAEFSRLYKTAAEKGFIFTDPRAAKGPGASMAKGVAELQKAIAEAGVPIEQTTTIKLDGQGMMVGMMNKMIGGSTTSTLVKVDEETIPADLFTVPADYKVKKP
jgi:Domain of unknown function (DUF4412)